MIGDGAHTALQRNATMQGHCVRHLLVIIVCMLRLLLTMRSETNKITIQPLRRQRFYCTLQSILRYHCSCSNLTHPNGRNATVALKMHSFHPIAQTQLPTRLPLHNPLLHAPMHISGL